MLEGTDAELFLIAAQLELTTLRPLTPVQDILHFLEDAPLDILHEPFPFSEPETISLSSIENFIEQSERPLHINLKGVNDASSWDCLAQGNVMLLTNPADDPPKTPVTDEWDRSSIFKDDPGNTSSACLEDENTSLEESNLAQQQGLDQEQPDQEEPPVPSSADEAGKSTVAELLSLEALDDMESKIPVENICHLLNRSLCSQPMLIDILKRIELVWGHLKQSLIFSKSESIRDAFTLFTTLLKGGAVEESFIISCCADCVRIVNCWNGLESCIWPLITFLVELAQLSEAARQFIYEDGVLLQLQQANKATLRIKMGAFTVEWFSLFACLDFRRVLEKSPFELTFEETLECCDALDFLLDFNNGQVAEKLSFLSKFVSDLTLLLPCFDLAAIFLILKLVFRRLLSMLLLSKLKSDERIKALEACGTASSALRKFEHRQNSSESLEIRFDGRPLQSEHYDRTLFHITQLLRETEHPVATRLPTGFDSIAATNLLLETVKLGPKTDKFIALLIKALGDPSPLIRAKAIKELSRVIVIGDSLLGSSHFAVTLYRRLDDCSPLVRDAALDFIVKFHKHGSWPDMYHLLSSKINDDSIAVRKKVIKLSTDYVKSSPPDKVMTKILAMLIRQVSSVPESVSDLAFTCLKDCWIDPQLQLSNDPALVSIQLSVDSFARSIMDILEDEETDLLSCRNFFSKLQSDNSRPEQVAKVCVGVCEILLERLIDATQHPEDCSVKSILASLLVVSGNRAVGLENHFRLLCRFILADDISVVDHALALLETCLKFHGKALSRQSKEFHAELLRLTLRGSESILRKALCCLFCIAENDAHVRSSLCSFYRKISGLLMRDSQDSGEVSSVCRGMLAISLITRLGIEKHFSWPVDLKDTLKTLQHSESNIKHPSIRSFFCIAISELVFASPMIAFRPEIEQVLREGLLNTHGPNVQFTVLSVFSSSIEREQGNDHGPKFGDAGREPDYTSIVCALVQAFAEELKGTLLTQSKDVFESSALLLFKILKRGMIHPQSIIPSILSVWRCPWPSLEEKIGALCEDVAESYESFILPSVPQLTKSAFRMFHLVRGTASGLMMIEDGEWESVFQPIYKALGTKSRRKDFVHILLREIEISMENSEYSRFLIESISELRFLTMEEILQLDRKLTEMIMSIENGNELEDGQCSSSSQWLLIRLKTHLNSCYRLESLDRTRSESNPKKDGLPTRLNTSRIEFPDFSMMQPVNDGNLNALEQDVFSAETKFEGPSANPSDRRPLSRKLCRTNKSRKRKGTTIDKYCVSEEEESDE